MGTIAVILMGCGIGALLSLLAIKPALAHAAKKGLYFS